MRRLLIPAAALLWGFQFAFLVPALGLLLVGLYHASSAEIGLVMSVYAVGGFIAALVVPAWADRRHDYLKPLVACGVLTLGLMTVMWLTSSLIVVATALVLLGGPAGVGSSLLFAHLRHSGASAADVINTRTIVSFAWVAGPPLATFVMRLFGNRAIVITIAIVAVLNVLVTLAMMAQHRRLVESGDAPKPPETAPVRKGLIAVVLTAFVLLQATNNAGVTVLSLFVTDQLKLDVMWAGVALAVSAALEIPAMLLVGRLTGRWSNVVLVVTGCVAGALYYAGMVFVRGPVLLLALQAFNAYFFAVVAAVGLTWSQEAIPRPGLASGLSANTRRTGNIVSGPIISIGAASALHYGGVYAISAVVSLLTIGVIALVGRVAPAHAAGDGA